MPFHSRPEKLVFRALFLVTYLVAFAAGLTQTACATYVPPVAYAPGDSCDWEKMRLPSHVGDYSLLYGKTVRELERANQNCGNYHLDWGQKNYNAARTNYEAQPTVTDRLAWAFSGFTLAAALVVALLL